MGDLGTPRWLLSALTKRAFPRKHRDQLEAYIEAFSGSSETPLNEYLVLLAAQAELNRLRSADSPNDGPAYSPGARTNARARRWLSGQSLLDYEASLGDISFLVNEALAQGDLKKAKVEYYKGEIFLALHLILRPIRWAFEIIHYITDKRPGRPPY